MPDIKRPESSQIRVPRQWLPGCDSESCFETAPSTALQHKEVILTLRSCGSALSATDIAAVRAFDDHAFDETSLSGPWACATLLGSFVNDATCSRIDSGTR
jgi:hypothetical protein